MSVAGPIARVVSLLSRLPGIGERSASRMALHMLTGPEEHPRELAEALLEMVRSVSLCSNCCTFTEKDPCEICEDASRAQQRVCVVESVPDLMAIERTREFDGSYHVLHGLIAPLDGVGPDRLKIKELLARVNSREVEEVILATNPSVEGEATAMYLKKLLVPLDVSVTRIASGVPVGSDLEYSDRATLGRAITTRREY